MAKKDKTYTGIITQDMLSRSKVDSFLSSEGKTEYYKKGFIRRTVAWVNPKAGYVVKPVGGWHYTDGKKCANEVKVVYQSRILQKIGWGVLTAFGVTATALAGAELIGTLNEGPLPNNPTNDEPTYSYSCQCDETCHCWENHHTQTTKPNETKPSETKPKDEEEEGGFVVETPTEEETTDQTDDGFNVNTTNPPAGTTGGTTTGTTTENTETTKPSTTPTEEDAFKIPGVPGMLEGGSYQEDGPSQ